MKRSYFVLGIALVFATIGFAQGSGQTNANAAPHAANAWMLVPTPVSAPDNVPPAIRQARDKYFDNLLTVTGQPLTPQSAALIHVFRGSGTLALRSPEIRDVPNRAVFIGKFTSSRSVLSASRHALYTEITIDVSDAFEDVGGHATPGSEITICYMGGTVRTADGQVISLFTDPHEYSLQPAHTYLLLLQYNPEGNFYSLENDWDLTDGVVRVNTTIERERAKQGTATLPGQTVDQLRATLRQRFQAK